MQIHCNVLSDSSGLVDFPVGLVDYLLHLPNGQAVSSENFFGNSTDMNKYSTVIYVCKG